VLELGDGKELFEGEEAGTVREEEVTIVLWKETRDMVLERKKKEGSRLNLIPC